MTKLGRSELGCACSDHVLNATKTTMPIRYLNIFLLCIFKRSDPTYELMIRMTEDLVGPESVTGRDIGSVSTHTARSPRSNDVVKNSKYE